MKKSLQLLGLAAVVSATGTLANATTYNLGDLINNHATITVGDKVFGDFNMFSAHFNAADATVTPSIDGDTYYLTFQGPWVAVNGAAYDIGLNYTVATVSGVPLINMIDQAFVLSAGGNTGTVLLGETVRTGSFSGPAVAQSSLSFSPNTTPDLEDPAAEPLQGDNLYVNPPQAKLWVTKDIYFASAEGGLIGPTTVRQSFHQVSTPDTGATASLFGVALAGVAFANRKRS